MSTINSTFDRRDERTAANPSRTGVAHIGCSGWHYRGWRGLVYPPELPPGEWLKAYARRFSTVELNNTFYRLPAESTFAAWRKQVPRGFLFAVKASRFLTHIKRLREPHEPLERLLSRAQALASALGPVLYQIPPRWFPDPERLEEFLAALPRRLPSSRRALHHVMEMRDPRGYAPWVLDLLRRYDVALCVHDMPGSETPLVTTSSLAYLRFHGHGAKYGGGYPDEVLEQWAEWIGRLLARGIDVFAYFNNDVGGHAVNDAERLRTLVDRDHEPARGRERLAAHLQQDHEIPADAPLRWPPSGA